MNNLSSLNLSVILPVYNEENSLESVVKSLSEELNIINLNKFEIITVNDGSTDRSPDIIRKLKKNRLINNTITTKENTGYGYSLKVGIKNSKYNVILIIDADGTYPTKVIKKLISKMDTNDMVIGARTNKNVKIPFARIIPKKIITILASTLTGKAIPDLNSGLRVFNKSLADEFWHLFPDKFSFTTTITMASLMNKYKIEYVPINYKRRKGDSSIKSVDFFYFIALIVRLVVYYQPLRFFFWPGVAFIFAGLLLIIYTLITENNVTDTDLLIFITGVQALFFGLIADLIVKTRDKDKLSNDQK